MNSPIKILFGVLTVECVMKYTYLILKEHNGATQ